MLQRFLGSSSSSRRRPPSPAEPSPVRAFSTVELAAVSQLCAGQRRLRQCGGLSAIADEAAARAAYAELLADIDQAAKTFGLKPAPRDYRAKFSANYRALFPGEARLYHVDVLKTSLDRDSSMWINGENFELSRRAVKQAEALQHAWVVLCEQIDRWEQREHGSSGNMPVLSGRKMARKEGVAAEQPESKARRGLVNSLAQLDVAWAEFECMYIIDLMAMEDRARQLVARAAAWEAQLRLQLASRGAVCSEQAGATERELVQCIARLNSVANKKSKGRDDLDYDILQSARTVLRRCEVSSRCGGLTAAARLAARVLASDVLAAFESMRSYLREVSLVMERVDPHLCNNTGLAARLVEWEATWEVGARYLRDTALWEGLCDVVGEIKSAQAVAPELAGMFQEVDVELFWVLPRIVMLFYAASPAGKRAELVCSLLPHRFSGGETSLPPAACSEELQVLVELYRKAMQALEGSGATSSSLPAWRSILRRAVLGSGASDVRGASTSGAEKAVEEFMRELERWSLELQRHCPQDWNECSAVLVQCVTGRSRKQRSNRFKV